jgi:regulator of PEP synthase PpsR (kinase-PPPase family)
MTEKRVVYYVSDRTGLTAESYGRSLLAQFPGLEFESRRIAFVDSEEQAHAAAREISLTAQTEADRVLVFSTLVESNIRDIIEAVDVCVINLFSAFIEPLEQHLGLKSAHKLGMSQHVFGDHGYQRRLDAIDYSLAHDDGVRPDQYADADLVLVGVSRCGKTPCSLYLAMNFSLKVANYPLTSEDLASDVLPVCLRSVTGRLFGLTISPARLSNIREQRRPGSDYAALAVCQQETRIAEGLFSSAGIAVFDTTETSIEEVAGGIVRLLRKAQK